MAEAKEKIEAKIVAVSFIKKTDKGYRKYEVTFEGESSPRKMDIAPDNPEYPEKADSYEPKVGDQVTVWKGSFNSWVLDKKKLPGVAPAPVATSSGGGSDHSPAKGGNQYRDPKVIEFQENLKLLNDLYIACIPFLEEKPSSVDDIDGLADQIFAKARAWSA